MNNVLVLLLTINLILAGLSLYFTTKMVTVSDMVTKDIQAANKKINDVNNSLNTRVDNVIKISNSNSQSVIHRFETDAKEIEEITAKMQGLADRIGEVDKEVKGISRYYCNYVSKGGAR